VLAIKEPEQQEAYTGWKRRLVLQQRAFSEVGPNSGPGLMQSKRIAKP
jgi:hypothetical protein